VACSQYSELGVGCCPAPSCPTRKDNVMTLRLFAAVLVLAGLAAAPARAEDPQERMQGV